MAERGTEPEAAPELESPTSGPVSQSSGFSAGVPYSEPPEVAPPRRRRGPLAGGLVLAAVLGLASVLWISASPGPASESPSLTPAQTITFAETDLDAALTSRVRDAVREGGPVPLPAEFDPILLGEIAEEERDLYAVRLLDSAANDGDIVTVLVDERPLAHVILTNAGSILYLPIQRDATTTLRFEAKQDGGGGVTFAAASSQGQATTRVMDVGESEVWSVRLEP